MLPTRAQNCANNLRYLNDLRALKARFDAAFEELVRTGSKQNLLVTEKLQTDITEALKHSFIATNASEVNEYTVKYIGKLEPDIFKKLPKNIEICNEQGEELTQFELTLGSQKFPQLVKDLGGEIDDTTREMLDHRDFTLATRPERQRFILLTAADLGLSDMVPVLDVMGDAAKSREGRARELGLELCPPEAAVRFVVDFLHDDRTPFPSTFFVGMQPMTLKDGISRVFYLHVANIFTEDEHGEIHDAGTQADLDATTVSNIRVFPSEAFMLRLPENE